MGRLKVLFWDFDGTRAESERDGHLVAFNKASEASGMPWRWDAAYYGGLLRITGGRECLLFDMNRRGDAPPVAAARGRCEPGACAQERLLCRTGEQRRHSPARGRVGPGLHERQGWRPSLPTGESQPRYIGLEDIGARCAQMDAVSDYPGC